MDFEKYENELDYPIRPAKPRQPTPVTSESMLKYSNDLKLYEQAMEAYKIAISEYRQHEKQKEKEFKHDCLENYNLQNEPEKIRDGIFSLAEKDGHSFGYSEIYYEMEKYVDLYFLIKQELLKGK